MSQAFVRETDEQWLHEVAPTMNALIVYLTRENNGIRVYEQKTTIDKKTGKEIYHMSNGMAIYKR
jgi:hypothetical protein